MKEQNHVSPLLTRFEVFWFKYHKSHTIPEKHHLNLISFKGCSQEDFTDYLAQGHALSNQAFHQMIADDWYSAFQIYCAHRPYVSGFLTDEEKEKIATHLGYDFMLQRAIIPTTRQIRSMLQKKNFHHLNNFIVKACPLSDEAIRLVFESGSEQLALSFLTYNTLGDDSLLLLYHDNCDILREFAKRSKFSSKTAAAIARQQTTSRENAEFVFEHCQPLTDDDLLWLIDENKTDYITFLLENELFTPNLKWQAYLIKKGSSEALAAFVKNVTFQVKSPIVLDFLFQPKNQNLLIELIKNQKLPEVYEQRIFEFSPKEVKDVYLDYVESLNVKEVKLVLSEKDIDFQMQHLHLFKGYQAEGVLFKFGQEPVIQAYLDNAELSDFSLALLIKYAPKNIVAKVIQKGNCPPLAEIALAQRDEPDLLACYLTTSMPNLLSSKFILGLIQCNRLLLVQKILEEIHSISGSLDSLDVSVVQTIFKTQNADLCLFLSNNICCISHINAMVLYAPTMTLQNYIKQSPLPRESELLFIRRGIKSLIQAYIKRYDLSPEGENALWELIDEELVVSCEHRCSNL